jgi:Skp family chaperone for outer membrane proteins
MFAQVALVALALVWTRGRRFARALPAPRADRRSKLEFVSSMAELQQRARAYDLAIENIYQRTRRALARYGGLAPNAPLEKIAEQVARRSSKSRRELEALMRECEDSIAGAQLTSRRAVELARALRELERDLGILMRSREIRQAR